MEASNIDINLGDDKKIDKNISLINTSATRIIYNEKRVLQFKHFKHLKHVTDI